MPFQSPHFFFNTPPPTQLYTLSLHDALPISAAGRQAPSGTVHTKDVLAAAAGLLGGEPAQVFAEAAPRSEEHTSELQSRFDLVCRLLLEKKKQTEEIITATKQAI